MLRRRLCFIAIIFVVAVANGARLEPANEKLSSFGNSKIVCNDGFGSTNVGPCRRIRETENSIDIVTASVDDGRSSNDGDVLPIGGDDSKMKNNDKNTTAMDEGRGKKGKRGYLKVFFMMAAAAKATLLYVMIHGVALIAGKALVVAKVALALAAAVALKKALGDHGEKTSYEIVKHPQHSYQQTHSASVDYDHHGSSGGYEGGHRRRRHYAR